MKIKVINGFDGECAFKEPHIKTLTEYCNRHGYEFVSDFNIRKTSPYKKTKGYWWLKLYMIQQHLPTCDYLVWVDTDVIAINYGKSLEEIIGTGNFGILMKKEETEEAGVMILKNSDWTNEFIKQWIPRVTKFNNDNEALTQIL